MRSRRTNQNRLDGDDREAKCPVWLGPAIVSGVAATCLLLLGICTVSAIRSPKVPSSNLNQRINVDAPLASVDFPKQGVAYPSGWPIELRLPRQFTLLDTTSGSLPKGDGEGWLAKFRYSGPPNKAADELTSFWTSGGWHVSTEILDTGAVLLDIERNDRKNLGSFICDIDQDRPSVTRVLMFVRI